MKILYLTLKKKWFDMIDSGEKPEEYRELKRYWQDRLGGRFHDVVEFRHGYRKDALKMRFYIEDIIIRPGRPEWGAEPGKEYFVIKFRDRITI